MHFAKSMLLFMALILLSSCAAGIETNMDEPMADFAFTTQDKETLTLEDLKGDWWIANMAYTNCQTICPRTTANLVNVQERLKGAGIQPEIVSFSIEPSYDTPEVLKAYAKENGADQKTWHFLTGYDFETIQEISEKTFKSVLEKGAVGQRSHGYAFYLINPEGTIVKQYNGMSKDDLDKLVDDMKTIKGS